MLHFTIRTVGGATFEREFDSESTMREWVELQVLSTHPHWYVDWQDHGPGVWVARVKNESWVPVPDQGAIVVEDDDAV